MKSMYPVHAVVGIYLECGNTNQLHPMSTALFHPAINYNNDFLETFTLVHDFLTVLTLWVLVMEGGCKHLNIFLSSTLALLVQKCLEYFAPFYSTVYDNYMEKVVTKMHTVRRDTINWQTNSELLNPGMNFHNASCLASQVFEQLFWCRFPYCIWSQGSCPAP